MPSKTSAAPKPQLTVKQFQDSVVKHLRSTLGTYEEKASKQAWNQAVSAAINEFVFDGVSRTRKTHAAKDARAVHYLSLEFLMGRLMSNNLHNLGLYDIADQAMAKLGLNLADILEEESDMALGNGGLGRLAACFIDSMATLNLPAVGYGIHYEHGLFRQEFFKGRQVERPDEWREFGSAWEICRPESQQTVKLYGYVETVYDNGAARKVWHPGRTLRAIPWDIPIVGYGGRNVNVLRLWESRADKFFDWDVFNSGGYVDAYAESVQAETVSKVLYPNDETPAGKELRLVQQYFFSAASIADVMRRYKAAHGDDLTKFADLNAMQLNDTHPAIAIPELMRVLVDEEGLSWDKAWAMTRQTFAYTNHTLLPEALEKWPLKLIEKVLPRHLEIIFEINARFLNDEVENKWPGNDGVKRKLSIIEEGSDQMIRMGHLSAIGSHTVNGVAQIHSELVKKDLFPELNELWPGKFVNVTNGITPRRWMKACNPRLSTLIEKHIDDDWPRYLDKLEGLKKFADDAEFQKEYMAIKHANKEDMVKVIKELTDIDVSADAIFDVQIKRLHEYKRQHLNLLHIMALYRRLLIDPNYDMHPRVFIFGAKAAPGYKMAKDIIFAINKVAEKVNNDPRIKDKLKVVFLPNYRVSLAEKLIPAADVSEQISLAGKEASGTGNMKLALNGAITLGTMDGANIEIAEEAGRENVVIFGMEVDDVVALQEKGYNPGDYYRGNDELKAVLDWLEGDFFTPGEPGLLAEVKRNLVEQDPFMVLPDFESYCEAHQKIDSLYRDQKAWARAAIINTASLAKFNSDRSIADYADYIWHMKGVPAAAK
ncbi:glycogen/starch/alpha-glucan phosphorylase [Reinekea blandensis]|uniref:Alpha-1,4 glucan phosphorylase n=1 Tax=Reinekea blandensis MED297 TaxID=314283 RepID=A4BEC9_9GAMM|nr:glycogen/starch/alpha-glucan phosphorylase [Reinekea blandensis]EAR09607.1 glucan phosphorylase [Reinekea blandensis MED297]